MAISVNEGEIAFNILDALVLNSQYQYMDELIGVRERPIPADMLNVQAGSATNLFITENGSTFLKIDVQGMEVEVVEACSDILCSCVAVLIEFSFLPEYEGLTSGFSPIASLLMKINLYLYSSTASARIHLFMLLREMFFLTGKI
jgi:hypothetical protein